MNNYFQLSKEQQQMVFTQTANKTGLPVQAVEKDLWVTAVLQMVFSLPIADHLVFKGGTSLSKVWKVIRRFSYHKYNIIQSTNRHIFPVI